MVDGEGSAHGTGVDSRDDDLHPGLDLAAETNVHQVVGTEPDTGFAQKGGHRLRSRDHGGAALVVQHGDLVRELDADPCTGERQSLGSRRRELGVGHPHPELVESAVHRQLGRPDLGRLAVDDDLQLPRVTNRDGRHRVQRAAGSGSTRSRSVTTTPCSSEELGDRCRVVSTSDDLTVDAELHLAVTVGESGDAEEEGHREGTLESDLQPSRHPIDASGDHPRKANRRPQPPRPTGSISRQKGESQVEAHPGQAQVGDPTSYHAPKARSVLAETVPASSSTSTPRPAPSPAASPGSGTTRWGVRGRAVAPGRAHRSRRAADRPAPRPALHAGGRWP